MSEKKIINVEFNNEPDNENFTRFMDFKKVECTMTDDSGNTVTGIGHTRELAADNAKEQLNKR